MTCKDKKRQAMHARNHYLKNKDKMKKKAKDYTKKTVPKNRILIKAFLSLHCCLDCGNKDIRVFEFDHVRGIKKGNISTMIGQGCGLETIKKEILKCEIRCANCHRIKTIERRNK